MSGGSYKYIAVFQVSRGHAFVHVVGAEQKTEYAVLDLALLEVIVLYRDNPLPARLAAGKHSVHADFRQSRLSVQLGVILVRQRGFCKYRVQIRFIVIGAPAFEVVCERKSCQQRAEQRYKHAHNNGDTGY